MPAYGPAEDFDGGAAPWLLRYRPIFRNGDLQTVAGRYWPAALDPPRAAAEAVFFDTEPGVRVLGHWNRAPHPSAGAAVVAVHGLTGCAGAQYMLALARQALAAGYDVLRLNVRNCGGTEHLAPTLYHSGLTCDLRAVIESLAPRPLFVLGFSMGGNMVMKLAGEWGGQPPAHVRAVCGISVPIRLAECARALGRPRNRVYELRFLRQLRRTLLRKRKLAPHWIPEIDFRGVDSIFAFDDRFTAPAFGFSGAADYYAQCSSAGFLPAIRVPALLMQAADDPFIPFEIFDGGLFTGGSVHLIHSRTGGHVAFLARDRFRFWAQAQALRFFEWVRRCGAA